MSWEFCTPVTNALTIVAVKQQGFREANRKEAGALLLWQGAALLLSTKLEYVQLFRGGFSPTGNPYLDG